IELRDAVDERAEKLRSLMRVAVPALVSRGIVQTKVRAEIDEGNAEIEDRARVLLTVAMRERGEDDVHVRKRAALELLYRETWKGCREARMDGAERLPCPAVAEQLRGRELGVRAEKAQQLASDVARGSENSRSNHEERAYRRICIFMQVNV